MKEGTLHEMPNGKFELIDHKGESLTWFSCGEPIECYVEINDEMFWIKGRVEYKQSKDREGYYFYCKEAYNPYLYNGMRARIDR